MDFEVTEFDSQNITLTAPLEPNINHQQTAFGGSINSLLIMVAWSWIHRSLLDHSETGSIVIQNSQASFISPITNSMEASAIPPEREEVQKFYTMLRKFGKGRIKLQSVVKENGKIAARFEGSFVVLK